MKWVFTTPSDFQNEPPYDVYFGTNGQVWKKTSKSGNSLPGNFVILTEKIKKHIREICHTGGKFAETGGKF